jgi:EAL domain-containing protein (putative c-di-GMP-specific phosphodiesterase class I)
MRKALVGAGPVPGGLSIQNILRSRGVVTHFQPILSARQRSIVGLEALSRGTIPGLDIIAPRTIFRAAGEAGLVDELDSLCRQQAIQSFSTLHSYSGDRMLFLNLHVPVIQAPAALVLELEQLASTCGLTPRAIAIEILEAEIADMGLVRALVNQLRARGFLIVLDDVGAGHSNLDRIPFIKPDLLKIDRTLVARIDTDYHKRGTLKTLVDLGRKIGALVVAEGIETEGEAMVALELGADLLQGFFLGRPRESDYMRREGLADAFDRIDALANQFRGHMVEKIQERQLQHRRLNALLNDILLDLTGVEAGQFNAVLQRSVGKYASVECVYVLDHSGIQLTETVCNPSITRREHGAIFRPAPKGTDHSLKEYYYSLLDVEPDKHTTDPYVSLASGSISQTISTHFRDTRKNITYVLCIDVLCN